MALDTTAFDASLKNVYEGVVKDQLNEKTVMLDAFTKQEKGIGKAEWQGKAVIVDLHKSRNSGVKATAEGGGLPTAGAQGYANLTIPMRYIHGAINVSAQVMKASRSDKGAFTRAMESEQKGLVNDIARLRNRILCGYGSGTLAVISSGTASATQTLKDPGGVVGTTNVTRYINVGDVLAFTDSTGVTIRGVRTVSSISGSTVVLASSVTTTTGDLVSFGSVRTGSDESSYNLEPMGILGLADSSTYVSTVFGLDRSTAANTFFRSQIMTSVGTLSADILQRGLDNVQEVSGEDVNQLFAHQSIRREVIKLTEADRRYAGGSSAQNFDAGNKSLKSDMTFNDIPIKAVKDFAYGTIVGLNTEYCEWYPETEGEWADDDGSILLRNSNTDGYEARYRVFENFAIFKGNSAIRWDSVTGTVTSGVYAL